MENNKNAILINRYDDVATAIQPLKSSDIVNVIGPDGKKIETLAIIEDVPVYHKFALRDLKKNERIRKYGEIIGEMSADAPKGSYVHIHNLDTLRGIIHGN